MGEAGGVARRGKKRFTTRFRRPTRGGSPGRAEKRARGDAFWEAGQIWGGGENVHLSFEVKNTEFFWTQTGVFYIYFFTNQ